MKLAAILGLLLAMTAVCGAQSLLLTGPDRAGTLEGDTYAVTWQADGIRSVSVVAHGTRTPLGASSRGRFVLVIATAVPAERGMVRWSVPWIDSVGFSVKLKGYDSAGRLAKISERPYSFRPDVLADSHADGIYMVLDKPYHQRLYVQRHDRLVKAYICSSSQNYKWVPPGVHPSTPHDHAGVFRVMEKMASYWSQEYQLPMAYAMRYHGGHFIHATSSNLYRYLGRPASHGCNRLTRRDAIELFKMTPPGTRVEVIGPSG